MLENPDRNRLEELRQMFETHEAERLPPVEFRNNLQELERLERLNQHDC